MKNWYCKYCKAKEVTEDNIIMILCNYCKCGCMDEDTHQLNQNGGKEHVKDK